MTQNNSCSDQIAEPVTLSVIVPTFMEKDSIAELIPRLESSLKTLDFEVVIVDDASIDGTAEYAEDLNRSYSNIIVVRRGGKLGLSSAVLDGFKRSRAEVLAVMDADLQHPPELLPHMYAKIKEGYDLVVASRYVEGGRIQGWSLGRKVLSKGATMLAHLLLPETDKVSDIMSGFFMLKRDAINKVRLNPVGFKILLEIVVKGRYNSLAELPYTFTSRRSGKSNLSIKEVWDYLVHICRLL